MKKETLRFTPNIPLLMTFQFNQPKTGTGQYGEWYLYGVEHQGQDKGIFASRGLHDRLQQLGQLQGRSLEITKVVDEVGKTRWVIKENGTDITPEAPQSVPAPQNTQTPTSTPNTPPATPQTPQNANEKPTGYTLSAIKTLTGEIENLKLKFQAIEQEIAGFRTLMVDLKGKPAVELHTSTDAKTPEEKEEEIPIIDTLLDEPNLPK